jgi:3-oxoacyl-[acyl-carrier protein] reductase
VVGQMGNAGQVNYAAAKAGLAGMTRSLAKELGSRNITVNLVAPGFIRTDITADLTQEQIDAVLSQVPLERLGDPEDVAPLVGFLAGNGARYITGQVLHVDGGLVMS